MAFFRALALATYVVLQLPVVIVPLLFGKLFFAPGHPVNLYLRRLVGPLGTSPYLAFFSTKVSVQINSNLAHAAPGVSRFLLMTHSSTLDFMVVTIAAWMIRDLIGPAVCIIKQELLSLPFFGWLQVVAGSVPVARSGDLQAAKKNLAIAENRSREGYTIAGFPEGSRRRTPSCGPQHLLPFKKGMFHMAKKIADSYGNQVHFIPLVMIGGNTAWPANSFLPIPWSKIVIRVGTPIKMKPDETVDELTERVRMCMQDEIKQSGAVLKDGSYSIDAAFTRGECVSLWRLLGFEACLSIIPSVATILLAIRGIL